VLPQVDSAVIRSCTPFCQIKEWTRWKDDRFPQDFWCPQHVTPPNGSSQT
jgi:hypothetical protein